MKSLVTLSLAFLLAVGYATAACPYPYTDLGTGCYSFPEVYNTTWYEAFFYCLHDYSYYSSHLVEILDETEQNYLNSYINAVIDPSLQYDFWIGGADLEYEGSFRWMTYGSYMYYGAWIAGEPTVYDNYDCVGAVKWDQHHWDSIVCDNRNYKRFICKTQYISKHLPK